MNREQVIEKIAIGLAYLANHKWEDLPDNTTTIATMFYSKDHYLRRAEDTLPIIEQAGYRLVPELKVLDDERLFLERYKNNPGMVRNSKPIDIADIERWVEYSSFYLLMNGVAKAQRDYDLRQIEEGKG